MGGILYMEILKVEGVSKQIKNRKILDNISFSIFENEIVGLIGHKWCWKKYNYEMCYRTISYE